MTGRGTIEGPEGSRVGTGPPAGGRFELVACTRRSGVVESYHHGAVAGLAADGSVALAVGDVTGPVYGRSCNKPMQATAMVGAGLRLPPHQLALVCASHSGCDEHVGAVREILAGVGLTPAALANTADLPLDVPASHGLLRAGGGADSLHQNCSGKHAGMVATCVVAGWPHAGGAYLDPEHPLQRHITGVFADLAGESPSHIGVDGCGAPAHVFSLVGLARAMAAVVSGAGGAAGTEVADAMRGFPHLVGGPGRDVSLFMADIPGLVAKDGAEGVYVAALPDGRAVALKIADGASRARPVVMARALQALGVELPADDRAWHLPVLGHGREVGRVEAAGRFAAL